MGTKKITISHKRKDCIGCARCVFAAPQTWEMNEDGMSDLKGGKWKGKEFVVGKIDEDDLQDNKNTADNCPVQIIKIDGYNG